MALKSETLRGYFMASQFQSAFDLRVLPCDDATERMPVEVALPIVKDIDRLALDLKASRAEGLAKIPTTRIVSSLAEVASRWRRRDEEWRITCEDVLPRTSGLSRQMV